MQQLERALDQVGLKVEHIRLLVCTHAHSDHYGLAAPIVERAGCELWMHPRHEHMTKGAQDPDKLLDRRIEVARSAGVPEQALAHYEKRRGESIGIDGIILPDKDLLPGVEVQTDLGKWQVYETPGHAPSHVTLHQPDREVLISGDHLLGRVSLYYDYGWTPDPAGEFLSSLDTVDELNASLCLSGHGRPFRDVHEHVEANRKMVRDHIDRVRNALKSGNAKTPFELVPALFDTTDLTPMMVSWGLGEVLVYLRYLEQRDEATKRDSDGPADRWSLVAA
jgi:glyoxylase-like metal-dependent hydrolase (beta-lactamase superfamily II)